MIMESEITFLYVTVPWSVTRRCPIFLLVRASLSFRPSLLDPLTRSGDLEGSPVGSVLGSS